MKLTPEIDALLRDYFSGKATPDQVIALEAWLVEDPAHLQVLIDLALLDGVMFSEQKNEDASAILSILSEVEQSADLIPALLDAQPRGHAQDQAGQGSISFGEFCTLAGYLAGKALRAKAGVIGSIAAVLLLGALVYLAVLGPGNGSSPRPLALTPPVQLVATLTAEHNAVWARRPGQDLYAGQRFTLTAGFAEITTNRGAVAILEAPCTLELTDNDNAMRLISGKLVGICETESSKGFLVRTPHMDITDLGTRFGVDATHADRTEVHVSRGEVRVAATASSDLPGQSRILRAGEALASDPIMGLAVINADIERFVDRVQPDLIKPRFQGDPVLWGGAIPGDLAIHQHEADAMQAFIERQGLTLDQDIVVDLIASDQWPPADGIGQRTVKAGLRVDVYLLHLDPVYTEVNVAGTYVIRFDRPILVVMAAGPTLRASDRRFSPSVKFPTPFDLHLKAGDGSGLDIEHGDQAAISADGLTLTLNMNARHNLDQLRVLVQAHAGPQGQAPSNIK